MRYKTARRAGSNPPQGSTGTTRPKRCEVARRTVLAGLLPLPGLFAGLLEEVEPEIGNCATCLGPVDGTLGSCAGVSTCLSSYDDRPPHFLAPWEYVGSRQRAVQALKDAVQRSGGEVVQADGAYVHAVYSSPASGTDDFEFLFASENDATVALRAVPRRRALPDGGRCSRKLEGLRMVLGWDQVPILRNRQALFIFGESPWDSFGPTPPAGSDPNDMMDALQEYS